MTTIAVDTRNDSFENFKKTGSSSYGYSHSMSRRDSLSYKKAISSSRSTPSSRRQFALNRRTLVILALSVFTLLVVLFPATEAFGGKSLVSSERQSAVSETNEISIVVEPGDTLWSIAKKLEPAKDPRVVVDQLSRARGTSQVYSGEKITWSK